MNGYRFRRQYSIGPYVVDFYCPELRLAIEIDGPSHEGGEAREYDTKREEEIRELGITVVRFRNDEVLSNSMGVIRRIIDLARALAGNSA